MTTRDDNPRYWAEVVGRNVAMIRQRRGMSRAELVEVLRDGGMRVSYSQVCAMELHRPASLSSGWYTITIDRVMAIAEILGVTYLELLREP